MHLRERVDELGERDPLVEEPRRRELRELEAREHVRRRPLVVEEQRGERRVGVAGRGGVGSDARVRGAAWTGGRVDAGFSTYAQTFRRSLSLRPSLTV